MWGLWVFTIFIGHPCWCCHSHSTVGVVEGVTTSPAAIRSLETQEYRGHLSLWLTWFVPHIPRCGSEIWWWSIRFSCVKPVVRIPNLPLFSYDFLKQIEVFPKKPFLETPLFEGRHLWILCFCNLSFVPTYEQWTNFAQGLCGDIGKKSFEWIHHMFFIVNNCCQLRKKKALLSIED